MPRFYKFDYALRDPDGNIVDSSDGADPLWFVEGDGRMIPGLEKALAGKEQGDEFNVTVGPEDAYGWPQRSLVRTVSKDMIDANVEEIEAGMIFQVGSGDSAEVVKVVSVDDDGITVDGNHPLAGVTFHFDVVVLEARDATAEDLELAGSTGPQFGPKSS